MKEKYETPEMEVVMFEEGDVICTSGLIDGDSGDGGDIDFGNNFDN